MAGVEKFLSGRVEAASIAFQVSATNENDQLSLTYTSSYPFKIATNSTVSQASRFGCKQQAIGPNVQTVQKRKALEEQGKSSKKARTQRPRQKTRALFTLHVGLSAEISEAIDFLENDFDITSFKPEGASGKNEKRLEQLNR